ncbi:MAG: Uma2 family endonuclease [Deltaproteobacteria bacterium]|nr:Uma2 family endonuclease [Deltaproteobacteria bacterium]
MQPAYPVACYPVAPPPRGEDLPYSDGVPMESELHVSQMNLLADSLNLAWIDRTDFYVGRDMFLYFSELQSRKNDFRGPDVFVVLNTVKKVRRSWVVWEEDGRTPDVVIELTSPSTEHVDRGDKMHIYATVLRVPEYYLYDPFEERLDGYRLDPSSGQYRPIAADEHGWLRCEKLGLWLGVVPGLQLGVQAGWLRWIGSDGHVLPSAEELARSETTRAHAEARRAQAEADRAQAEADRAQAEADRAQAEATRADAEGQRADAAHEQLREAARRLLQTGMAREQVAALIGIDLSELDG